jgi:hypothetical protein
MPFLCSSKHYVVKDEVRISAHEINAVSLTSYGDVLCTDTETTTVVVSTSKEWYPSLITVVRITLLSIKHAVT